VKLSARGLSLIVLVAAIGISGYLSYLKISNTHAVCIAGGAFDCGTVLNSRYSELAGIPIAWLGLACNLIMTAVLLLEPRIAALHSQGRLIVFGISLFTFLFSIFLVYVQAALIQAFCPWCLTHEALMFILFGASVWRLRGMAQPVSTAETA
jgi:uncharacterized membrane protein